MSMHGRKMNSLGSDSDSKLLLQALISCFVINTFPFIISRYTQYYNNYKVTLLLLTYCIILSTVSSPIEVDTVTDSAAPSGLKQSFRFENKSSLANDLSFLAMMPEYCDVTFLVGENQQPMCGVKAILASRSR